MATIQQALAAAWRRVRPVLLADPDELRRRLVRRRSKLVESPPRAWCLAVRACDRRIQEYCLDQPDIGNTSRPNQVRLDSAALRRLYASVFLTTPGLPVDVVAKMLGTSTAGLINGRLS